MGYSITFGWTGKHTTIVSHWEDYWGHAYKTTMLSTLPSPSNWQKCECHSSLHSAPWASYQIRKISSYACAGNAGKVFLATNFKGNHYLAIPTCIKARAAMHVGIAKPRWRGKRSRHSRRMRNSQYCVSVKRPMGKNKQIHAFNISHKSPKTVYQDGSLVIFPFRKWYDRPLLNIYHLRCMATCNIDFLGYNHRHVMMIHVCIYQFECDCRFCWF